MMNSVSSETDYFKQEHVHTMADGRGPRLVFIDDVEYSDVTYVDTAMGIAVVVAKPLRVFPGTDYLDEFVVMGDVRVEPKAKTYDQQLRGGSMPHADGSGVMMVVTVFLIGVAIGTKMVGGW